MTEIGLTSGLFVHLLVQVSLVDTEDNDCLGRRIVSRNKYKVSLTIPLNAHGQVQTDLNLTSRRTINWFNPNRFWRNGQSTHDLRKFGH
jgi:hypothetical protein